MKQKQWSDLRDEYCGYLPQLVQAVEAVDAQPENAMLRDALIQRFKCSFELAWKMMRAYLSAQGAETNAPRLSIRYALDHGLLPDDAAVDAWQSIADDRNLAPHAYTEALAGELAERIARVHLARLTALAKTATDL